MAERGSHSERLQQPLQEADNLPTKSVRQRLLAWLHWPRPDSPWAQWQLMREYLRKQITPTYASQAASLMLILLGLHLQVYVIAVLGALRFMQEGLKRVWGRVKVAELDASMPEAKPPRFWALHNLTDGAAWAVLTWSALFSPMPFVSQAILFTVPAMALVVEAMALSLIPRQYGFFVTGFALGWTPAALVVGGFEGLILVVGIGVLLALSWDMGRLYHRTIVRLLHMQTQRDQAIERQNRMIRQLDAERMRVTEMAVTDPVTGMVNRAGFMAELNARLDDPDARFVLVLIDMDFFKSINDTLGHDIGDAVLVALAELLSGTKAQLSCTSVGDVLAARMGGDEFALLIDGTPADSLLQSLFSHWAKSMSQLSIEGVGAVPCSLSAGCARAPADAQRASSLMHAADMALRKSKRERRGVLQLFDAGMVRDFEHDSRIAVLVREAIANEAFEIVLQPKVDMLSARVLGGEMLTRFTQPELAAHPVGTVYSVAESRGLGRSLALTVLRASLAHALQLQTRLPDGCMLAINLSLPLLKDQASLLSSLQEAIDQGLKPAHITLEVHESALMGRSLSLVQRALQHLAALGFQLSLDDFGSGESAMTMLHRLPITEVKVAPRFVQDIGAPGRDRAMVKSILTLCRELELDCIIKGLEHDEQASHVTALGATMGQGFLWAHPMPVQAFVDAVQADQPLQP